MSALTLGVLGASRKENERRLPIHPRQLGSIEAGVRERISLEAGYGLPFGFADDELAPLVTAVAPREQLIESSGVLVLPKPTAADLERLPEGRALWGWVHCVQDAEITQLAIDRRQTLIAWEEMHRRNGDGSFERHIFHRNNELAGYCSVIHALQLTGLTGSYGRDLRAAVIGFGATGRGAVAGLAAMGIDDVAVLTKRDAAAVTGTTESMRLVGYERDPDVAGQVPQLDDGGSVAEFLAGHDIIVNCVLQDTDAPLLLVADADLPLFPRGTLFVDVSVDAGMGFEWSRPTSFEEPLFTVGDGCRCYAVDHSPSLLWDSASWEIGAALIPFLAPVLAGPAGWEADPTIGPAIEIRDGVVQNPKILSFQGRSAEYPHRRA